MHDDEETNNCAEILDEAFYECRKTGCSRVKVLKAALGELDRLTYGLWDELIELETKGENT